MNNIEYMKLLDRNSGAPKCKQEPIDLKQLVNELTDIAKVTVLEDELKRKINDKEVEQIEIKVKNYFVPGVYIREIFMPKGAVLTGKIHKYPQFHVITSGCLDILIDGQMVRLKAPMTIMSPAGAKRLAVANEDTYWLMVHGTWQTNIDEIEKFFTCNTEEEYLAFVAEEERQLSLFADAEKSFEKCQ